MRGAHLVSLELLLTYFWGIAVLISPLGSAIFAVFNISFYTKIWIKHVRTVCTTQHLYILEWILILSSLVGVGYAKLS